MPSPASLRSLILLALMITLSACGPTTAQLPAPTAAPVISAVLGGSGGGTTLLKHIVAPYQDSAPTVALDFLQGSGSSLAKKAVLEGTLDVAILLSADSAAEQQDGLEQLALASDPVAFAVNGDLAIDSLTSAQLRDIYLGKLTSWAEVGGPDAPIVVLARDEDEGSTKILRKALFGDEPWTTAAIVLTKASELTEAVKSTPNSIGFGSYGAFTISGDGLKIIAVANVHPRDYAAGQYAFPARTLAVMYTPANQQRLQPLLAYLSGATARRAMHEAGIVPLP